MTRSAQGAELDRLALGLHLLAAFAGLRLLHPLATHLQARRAARFGARSRLELRAGTLELTTPTRELRLSAEEVMAYGLLPAAAAPPRLALLLRAGAVHVTAPGTRFGGELDPADPGPALERFLSPRDPTPPPQADPMQSAADLFDTFRDDPGTSSLALPLRGGAGVWWSAPYAALVFGLVLSAHALSVPMLRSPSVLALSLLGALPLMLWWRRGRALRRARGGVRALLTPSLFIVRDVHGARSCPWQEVQALRVVEKRAWDLLRGARSVSVLVVSRRGFEPILISEDELDDSIDVAEWACATYRAGVTVSPAASS